MINCGEICMNLFYLHEEILWMHLIGQYINKLDIKQFKILVIPSSIGWAWANKLLNMINLIFHIFFSLLQKKQF